MAAITDPCRFFPAGAGIVCRREYSPGDQGVATPPYGHVSTDLAKDIQDGFFRDTGCCDQMADDDFVLAMVKRQLVINHCGAFVDIVQTYLYDLKLVTLHADEFITVDAVKNFLRGSLNAGSDKA